MQTACPSLVALHPRAYTRVEFKDHERPACPCVVFLHLRAYARFKAHETADSMTKHGTSLFHDAPLIIALHCCAKVQRLRIEIRLSYGRSGQTRILCAYKVGAWPAVYKRCRLSIIVLRKRITHNVSCADEMALVSPWKAAVDLLCVTLTLWRAKCDLLYRKG